MILADIPCRFMSSRSGLNVGSAVLPGDVFVVFCGGFQASMQDADEPVRELAEGGMVTDFPGTQLVVVGARTG